MEYVPRPWLKEAARAVIATLQTISQLREANVIIIGGFALQTHINDRKTKVSCILALIFARFACRLTHPGR